MPRPFSPIPKLLHGPAFDLAEARALGIGRGALAHPRFDRPFRGVRRVRVTGTEDLSLREQIDRSTLDYLPHLRRKQSVSFSHSTALVLLGCPIRCPAALHVIAVLPERPPLLAGTHAHTTHAGFTPWSDHHGRRIVPPQLALLQSAGVLPVRELVVAIDHLVSSARRSSAHVTFVLSELVDLLDATSSRGVRGIRNLRTALRFAREGSESRMETLLRLLMAQYGLDILDLQVDICDAHGEWIGRFDMVDRDRKLIVEYDGEQHRTSREQYLKDVRRLDRARAAGYQVLRLHREDVLDHPFATAARIAEFLGRPLRPVSTPTMRLLVARS